MKKAIKRTLQAAAIVGGLTVWAYQLSPKIGYQKHEVEKELVDNLWKKEILKDQETNDIIKLMSGKITQDEFDNLLARHGHINDGTRINELIQPDEAMYKTILEMQTKYGNPKNSFWWFFINILTWENEPTRSRINPVTNTINSHQLDSVLIKFDNIKTSEEKNFRYNDGIEALNTDTRQKYLLNNWIAELSHIKQIQEKGSVKFILDIPTDFVKSWFSYPASYEKKWTQEYQAHKEYEPQLIKEFINTYQKYVPKESDMSIWNLAKFNAGFFEKYKDEKEVCTYLNILWKKWDSTASYFLANIYFNMYTKNFVSGCGKTLSTNEMVTKEIFGKEYIAKTFFKETINRFRKTYYLWSVDAGLGWILIASSFAPWKYNDVILEIGKDLLKNHKHEIDKAQLAKLCARIWRIYYQQNDLKNGAKYMKMSQRFSWWKMVRWY